MTNPIRIIKDYKTIRIITPKPTPLNVEFFTFTATAGQTVFTLPSTPFSGGLFVMSINGSPQDKAGGDFTVVTNILTLDQGVDLNDTVYGLYEKT